MKKLISIYFIIFAALLSSFTIVSAKDIDSVDPKIKETWIAISGTATDLKPTEFTLDYGKGEMTVKMAGWKWYTQNYKKMAGDRVTVYGRFGETLFEGNFIDPTSILDGKLGKYFYGRSAYETEAQMREAMRDPVLWFYGERIPAVGGVTIQGTVTSVNGNLFTVNTGDKKLTVNTSSLPYNPFDKNGRQAISKGAYLSVTGYLSKALTEKGDLIADHIIVLEKE